jgi:hypothetical protein
MLSICGMSISSDHFPNARHVTKNAHGVAVGITCNQPKS